MEQPTRVKDLNEAWARLKHDKNFWVLVALFALIPIVRILGL